MVSGIHYGHCGRIATTGPGRVGDDPITDPGEWPLIIGAISSVACVGTKVGNRGGANRVLYSINGLDFIDRW